MSNKKVINTPNAPSPIGPYNQAIQANGLLFVSGQIPINPATNELIVDNIKAETQQVLANLQAILDEAGLSASAIIKTTIFLSDMSYFQEVNSIYESFVEEPYPARETVAVKGLPKNVNVEISLIATFD